MNWTTFFAVVAVCSLVTQATPGQSLLSQTERASNPGAAALPPAAATPARGGYLGFVPDEQYAGRGVRIEAVKQGAPAAQGGLKDGDLITAVDGRALTNLTQFDDLLDQSNPGQQLKLTVDRGGRSQQLTVTLGTRTSTPPAGTPTTDHPGSSPPGFSGSGPAPAPGGLFSAPINPGSPAAPSLSAPGNPSGNELNAPSLSSPTLDQAQPSPRTSSPAATDTPPRSIRAQPLELGSPPSTAADSNAAADSTAAGDRRGSSSPANADSSGASLGITVVPLTEQGRAEAGVSVRRGALISTVKRGSPAEQAGLPVGGVIARIDNREVHTADDVVSVIRAARPGQEVEVTYYDRSRLNRKVVRLAAAGGGMEGVAADSGQSAVVAPPAPAPPIGEGILRAAPGALGNRPILRNLGQMAENLARPGTTSTVYDPIVVATLQNRVAELSEQMRQLEERIRMLESKLGSTTSPPASQTQPLTPPVGVFPPSPAFGAPSGATPGFGPAIGGAGTSP